MASIEDIQAEFDKAAAQSTGTQSDYDRRRADRIASMEKGEYQKPLPKLTLGRAKDAIIEEIHTGIRSQIVGFGAIAGGVERRGRSARKTRNEELAILQKKLGQDKYINRDEQRTQYTEFASKVLALEAAEWLKADPKFQVSSGWIEDQLRSLTQVGSQVLATAVGGYGLGAMYMGNFIVGSTYQNLKRQGVDDDRALIGSVLNAAVQAPMEQVGISKVTKLWMPRKQSIRFFKELAQLAGLEFTIEYIQNLGPEQFFEIWATNPSDTTKEQLQKWEARLGDSKVHAEAFKEGGHAALSAVLLGAPGAYRVSKAQQAEKTTPEEDVEADLQEEEEVAEEEVAEKKEPIEQVIAKHKLEKGIPLTEEDKAALEKKEKKEKPKPKPKPKKKKEEPKPKEEAPVEEAAAVEEEQEAEMDAVAELAAKMEQEQIPPVEEKPEIDLEAKAKKESDAAAESLEKAAKPKKDKKKKPPSKDEDDKLSLEDLVKRQIEESEFDQEGEQDTTEEEDQETLDKLMTEATPKGLEELTSRFGAEGDISAPPNIDGKPLVTTPTPSTEELLEVMAEEEGTDLDELKEKYSEFLQATEEQDEAEGPTKLGIKYSEMTQPVFVGTGKDKGKVIKGKKHEAITGRGTGGHNKEQRKSIDTSHSALRKRTEGMQGFIGYPNAKGEVFSLKEIEENKIGSRKYMSEDPNSPANKWRGESGPYIVEMKRKMRIEKAAEQRFMKESEGAMDLTKDQDLDLLTISNRVKRAAWNRAASMGRPQDFDDLYNGAMLEALSFVRKGKDVDKFHAKNAVLKQAKKTGLKGLVFPRGAQERGRATEVVSARNVEDAKKKEEAIDAIRTEMSDIENNASELGINFSFDNPEEGLVNIDAAINSVLDSMSDPMQQNPLLSKQLTLLSQLKLRTQGTLIDPDSPVRVLSDVGKQGSPEFETQKAIMLKEREKPTSVPYVHKSKVSGGVLASEMKAPPGVDKYLGENPSMQAIRDYVKDNDLNVTDKSKVRLLNKVRAAEKEASEKLFPGTKKPPTEEEIKEARKEKGIFKTKSIHEERVRGLGKRSVSTLKTAASKVGAGDRKSLPDKKEYMPDIPTRVYGDKLSKQSSVDLAIEKRNREVHKERKGLPVREYAPTTKEEAELRRKEKKERLKELIAPKPKPAAPKAKPKKKETKPKGKITIWDDTPATPLPVKLMGSAKERTSKVEPETVEEVRAKEAVSTPSKRKSPLTREDREVLALRQKARSGKTLAEVESEKAGKYKGKPLAAKKKVDPFAPDSLDTMSISKEEMNSILEGKDKATQDTLRAILGEEYEYKLAKVEQVEETPSDNDALDRAIERGKELPTPEPIPDLKIAHEQVLADLKDSGPKLDKKGEPKLNSKGERVPWSTKDAMEEANAILRGKPSDRVTGTTIIAVEKAYGKESEQAQSKVDKVPTFDEMTNVVAQGGLLDEGMSNDDINKTYYSIPVEDRSNYLKEVEAWEKVQKGQGKKPKKPSKLQRVMDSLDTAVQGTKKERGSSPELGEAVNMVADAVKWMDKGRKSVVDTFDVEAPWRRMGLHKVGRAFKNFFSVKTMHMDEGVQEAKHIADTLKESIPNPTSRDWADILLLHESKDYKRRMEIENPARFKKLEPASIEYGKFYTQAEDMLKHRGIDNNPIDRMLAEAEEKALNADTFAAQMKWITRIDELMDTNYVHISIASLFKESLQSNLKKKGYKKSKEAKKFLEMMTQKQRRAISISSLVQKHEELDISMIDPIDIMLRYQNRFAKDMALLDIRDALKEGGKLKSIGKKKPKGWIRLGRAYGVLVDNNVDPDTMNMINNLYKAEEGGNALTRSLSYVKMAAFFNPIFLPAYDIYQAGMSGVLFRNPIKYTRNLAAGYRDVRTQNLAYKESQTAGTFSKPFEYPYAKYLRNVKSIKEGAYWEGLGGATAKDIVSEWAEGGVARVVGKTLALRPLYSASWNIAWSMDAMIRQATYRTLKEKGMNSSEAGQLAAKFHGDYASVPARTRHIMNTFLFTPTFKFAMGKLYYSMLKGSVQGAFNAARGKKVSKNQKAMMGALVSTAVVTMAFDMLMDSLGYTSEGDDDWNWLNYGRRYKRKQDVRDEWGRPREIIFTWSNPGNLLQRYAQRISEAKSRVGETGYPGAFFNVAKWDLHPAFTTYLNLRDNRDDEGKKIWSRFDDPEVQAFDQAQYAVTRMIRAWDAAESMFNSNNPEGKKLAHKYIKKDMGHFSKLVTNPWISVASAYDRGVAGQRLKYRVNKMKSDFMSDQRKHVMEKKVKNSKWLENYKKRMEEERRLLNEWKRKRK